MRLSSVTFLLAGLASGISAGFVDSWEDEAPLDFVGTFDTFTNQHCSQGGRGITITDKDRHGELGRDVESVKSYISTRNILIIWTRGLGRPPLLIGPNDSNCHKLDGPGRQWRSFKI